MKRIGIVAGTRPEAIKMAPLYLEMKKSKIFSPYFISTAQHRQMLDQALSMFNITPDYDMDVMKQGQTLSDLTSRIINAWSDFFSKQFLDAVLVQGDTTTVLSSAISAFYHRVPIGHVEAGLRTGNMMSPFPEEMNRRLVSPLARWSFAPTQLSYENLIKENIDRNTCFVTGNTVVDSLLLTASKLEDEGVKYESVVSNCKIPIEFAERFIRGNKKWILVTGHRRESFGGGFENICKAISELVKRYSDCGVLYPVHLNPSVQEPVNRLLGNNLNIALIPPVGYKDFIWLMKNSFFVLSDSGGVQEEAPSLGKPVLVMRDTTERPEGIDAGTCRLVGTNVQKILEESKILLENNEEYKRRSALKNPYGDGTASKNIVRILEESL